MHHSRVFNQWVILQHLDSVLLLPVHSRRWLIKARNTAGSVHCHESCVKVFDLLGSKKPSGNKIAIAVKSFGGSSEASFVYNRHRRPVGRISLSRGSLFECFWGHRVQGFVRSYITISYEV